MKKLILSFALILSTAAAITSTGCKKEAGATPASATTTPPGNDTIYVVNPPPAGDPHFQFYWNYHNAGDPTTYSDSGCLTQAEMNTLITTIGAFNVVKSVTCTP